jgi:hypothetical protein
LYILKRGKSITGRAPLYEERSIDFLHALPKVAGKPVTREELFKEGAEEGATIKAW